MASGDIRLYDVSNEASKWSSLSVNTQRCEKALKISLITGGILLLIGVTIAIYFLSTTSTSNWCEFHKTYHVISNAVFIPLPTICGGGLAIAMLIGGILCSFERSVNGFSEDLKKEGAHEELAHLLTKCEIKDVYERYYQKNGGLGPLVHQGYMLPEQAEEMKEILEQYHENRGIYASFLAQPRTKKAIDDGNSPQECEEAQQKMEQANQDWAPIREQIAKQYKGGN